MWKLAKKMSIWAVLGAILFLVVQVVCDLYLPTLTSDIINTIGEGAKAGSSVDIGKIWQIGFKMLGFTLIGILASCGNVFLAARQSQKLGKTIRSEVYEEVAYFSLDEFDQVGTSSLITRTTNDVTQIQNFVVMFLRMMMMAPLMLIGASFLAYSKDAELTKVFLYVLPLLALFVGIVMYFAVPLFKSIQKKTDRLNLVFREGLTGVRVIRAFNRSKFEFKRFDKANKDYTDTAVKVNTIMAMMMPIMTLLMSGTNIAIIWFGGHYIADMNMEVGNLVAFMTYAMQILMSFVMLSMVFVFVPRAQASAVRINEVLDMKSKVVDKKNAADISGEPQAASLVYKNVSYRYEGAENPAIADVDFTVKANQTVAIIGGTGSGKSTFVNLIPRFYDASEGTILVNGVDIRDMTQKSLREQIGFVPQKATLFTGTIRSNLQYGNPKASDEDLWRALEISQSIDFVKGLPEGLDSHVEQNGGNFSGGQRQRLCIARALVNQMASIYVFDDSFSALDFKTDANLRKALQENIHDKVIVIVAQRISTVVDADLILVLDEGRVVGQGTHEELKATNQTYQEIIRSQLKEEEIA